MRAVWQRECHQRQHQYVPTTLRMKHAQEMLSDFAAIDAASDLQQYFE